MMRQDILCRGIVRVSRVCMHSNEPFIMGCVVCVRCVPPVDTTAHRVDKAPHPARRRAAEVRSSPALPRIPDGWQWPNPKCGNARGPRAGPRQRPRDARDRPRRARSRAVRGCIIVHRVLDRPEPGAPDAVALRATRTARRPDRRHSPFSSAALSSALDEVSCRHQKSTNQFQIRMRRRLRATDNTRCDGRATVLGGRRGAGPRARGSSRASATWHLLHTVASTMKTSNPLPAPDVPCRLAPPM
jgi:hypothetical protein